MNIRRFLKKQNAEQGNIHFEVDRIESLSRLMVDGKPSLLYQRSYAIIWIVNGSGELRVDLAESKMYNDTVCFIKPSQTFELEVLDNTTGFVICFSKEFVELYAKNCSDAMNIYLFNQLSVVPIVALKNDVSYFLKQLVGQMIQEVKNRFDLSFELMTGFLKIFTVYLTRQFDDDNSKGNLYSRSVKCVTQFYALLEDNFASKKSARDYAGMLNVTPGYLNDMVKQVSGYTVTYHIQQRVILEAKRRAIFDRHSLKEVAYCLGFFDPAHFSKYFKKSCGRSFTDFKREAGF